MYKITDEYFAHCFVTSKDMAVDLATCKKMAAVTDTFSGKTDFYKQGRLIKTIGGNL